MTNSNQQATPSIPRVVKAGKYSVEITERGRIARGPDMQIGLILGKGTLAWELVSRILELESGQASD